MAETDLAGIANSHTRGRPAEGKTTANGQVSRAMSYIGPVFDWAVVEAAEDLGSTLPRTLLRVVLPLLAPAILTGALLAFTLSLDEFIIAFFTAGAGRDSTTLPMQIYAMIRFGVTPEVNALATLVMGLSVVLFAATRRANRGVVTAR
jgi:spermidine/putrescine transport system permease protein